MRRLLALLLPLILLTGCVGLGANETPAQTVTSDGVEPASTGDDAAPSDPAPAQPTPAPTSPPAAPAPSANGTQPAPPADEAPPAPRIEVLRWDGTTVSGGLGAVEPQPGVCCAVAASPDESGTPFEVPEGLQGVVVELIWADAQVDLDLRVSAADWEQAADPQGGSVASGHAWSVSDGTPAAPDGHATLVVTDAEALAAVGTWTWRALAKGVAPQTAFSVVVSLFHDEAPPDGYAAPEE